MHKTEYAFGLLDDLFELSGLCDIKRHRLFAHHMETGFEKCLGDWEMPVVRNADRNKIDPLTDWKSKLLFDHLFISLVNPFGVKAQFFAHLFGFAGVNIKRP